MSNDPLWTWQAPVRFPCEIRPFNNEWTVNFNSNGNAIQTVSINKDGKPVFVLAYDGSVTIQTNETGTDANEPDKNPFECPVDEFYKRYTVDLSMLDTALESLTTFLRGVAPAISVPVGDSTFTFVWSEGIGLSGLDAVSLEEEFRHFIVYDFHTSVSVSIDGLNIPTFIEEYLETEIVELVDLISVKEQKELISLVGSNVIFNSLRIKFMKVAEIIRNIEKDILAIHDKKLSENMLLDLQEYVSDHNSPIYFN